MTNRSWAIAIFSARESAETLLRTIAAVERASSSMPSTIDVVVNGNRALALDVAASLRSRAVAAPHHAAPHHALRIWFIALGDKAHAWNQYLRDIAPAADIAFFIDGYVRPAPDSLSLIDQSLAGDPEAWIASGVPTVGRSATRLRHQLLTEGGIHGNLYALRSATMDLLKRQGFRLPLGIYRTDPLLGSVVRFSADPANHAWNKKRIAVVPDATWSNDRLSWARWSSLRTHFKRVLRQAQGDLETAAIRQHLARERRTPESLPDTAAQLVADWIAAHPADAKPLLRHPLRRRAARLLAAPREWSLAQEAPLLLHASGAVDG